MASVHSTDFMPPSTTNTPVMITRNERREPEEVHLAEQRQIDGLVTEDGLDGEGAGEDGHRRLGEDVAHQEDEREQRARAGRIAALEELGRREYFGAQIERREDPAEHQHEVRVQLPVREGHAGVGARTREADQVLRADVRREDRRADQEPAGAAAGEEVVRGVLFFLQRAPDADGGVGDEVQGNDRPVERAESNRGTRHVLPSCNGRPVPPVTLAGSFLTIGRRRPRQRRRMPGRSRASNALIDLPAMATPRHLGVELSVRRADGEAR